jgi:hypothetical protein
MKRGERGDDEDLYDFVDRQKREREEDAADRMERELKEEQEFDAIYRRPHFEVQDYDQIRSHEHFMDSPGDWFGRQRQGMEAGWFRRVLAAKLPRGPDGRANATAPFPVAMARRQYNIPLGDPVHMYEYRYNREKKEYLAINGRVPKKRKEGE